MIYTVSKKILILSALLTSLILFGCNKPTETSNETPIKEEIVEINNFQDCLNAGHPIMESYPRQCAYNGITFTEEIVDKQEQTGEIQETTIQTGEIQEIIDEYKSKNTGEFENLNENDIDLIEKVIEKIENK